MQMPPSPTVPVQGDPPAAANGRARTLRGEFASLLLFVVLAAVHTWPLAAAPGRWSRNDNGDTLLNEWAIAWVSHALVTDPAHLFDANIFYPEKRTLAYSEDLIPQSLMAAPILWSGGSPVLAHNLVLLLGFILTGWATAHVLRVWTGSWAAGAVAGSLAAFNASSLSRITHVQAQHLEFLPLALLAFDGLLRLPSVRTSVRLAVWFALQGLASGYFMLFSMVSLAVAALSRPAEWTGVRWKHIVPYAALTGGVAIAILAPFVLPYWELHRQHLLVRQIDDVLSYSAEWKDYLFTNARIHRAWSRRFAGGDCLFPGVVALVCSGAAVVRTGAWRDARIRMLAAIALVTFCLSFGPRFPLYGWLYRFVPLFDSARAAVRFGQVTLLAIAMLGGFGAAWMLGCVRSGRMRAALAAGILILANVDALVAPVTYVPFTGVPKMFASLRSDPHAVLACFPFFAGSGSIGGNARYMLDSTANWRPMINGYSGFIPPAFYDNAAKLSEFPLPQALDYLRQLGVTHVVVDMERLSAPRLEALGHADRLHLLAMDRGLRLYRLD